jgi:hypothetical protein
MPELAPAQKLGAPLATAEDYKAVFVGFRQGQKVLEHLVALFHDRPVYVVGGLEAQRETEARAAQKEVVGFILRKIGQIEEDPHA